MPDQQAIKSKRETAAERLKTKYPDRDFGDDEALFGQILDDYDENDRTSAANRARIEELEGREKAFSDMFTSDPRSARVMMEWKEGGDVAASLIRIYGDDILEAAHDPDKQEEMAAARKEYAEKMAKNKEYDRLYDENLEKTLQMLAQYSTQQGLSDEEIDAAMEKLTEISTDFLLGKVTEETVGLMLNALNHDNDVEAARGEGEVAGRNAKITEKLRKRKQGDGTRPLSGKNSMASAGEGGGKSIFDLASEA